LFSSNNKKERPKAALQNTAIGLESLYFKPFHGYSYFTFDINTTVSTCTVIGNISTGRTFSRV
jgi:hypothetical protein